MKIGFTGPYATANFGDWAMLVNNIFDFGIDNEFVVFTYSYDFPHNVIKHYFSDNKVSLVTVLADDSEQCAEGLFPLNMLSCVQNKDVLLHVISDLDVLVVSGGGWIDDCWCNRTSKLIKVFAPILLAAQSGVPVRFMAQGIGPVHVLSDTLRFCLNYLPEDTVFSVRDEYCSRVYLQKLIQDKYTIQLLPDDLAVINAAIKSSASDNPLGIDSPYVVLVVNDDLASLSRQVNSFQEFAQKLAERYNYKTVLLPFDLVWFGEEQSYFLHNNILNSYLVDIQKNRFVSVEDTVSIIEGAQLVLTGRHHAAVVAMQAHTPFIVKLDKGRQMYAYNKAYGVLNCFMRNICFEDSLFIRSEWQDIFDCVSDCCDEIIQKQKTVFASSVFQNNEKEMAKLRTEYIRSIKNIS